MQNWHIIFLPSYFFCFIKQSNKILNVKLSGKIPYWTWGEEGKNITVKICCLNLPKHSTAGIRKIPAEYLQKDTTALHMGAMWQSNNTTRLAQLLQFRRSNFWCTGFVLALWDQEGQCLSGFYVSPASSMFWTPALFKNRKLPGKEE